MTGTGRKSTIPNRARHRPKSKLTNMFTQDRILGIVRHLLTTFGGVLVSKGTIDAGQLEIVAGGIIAIAGVVWSVMAVPMGSKVWYAIVHNQAEVHSDHGPQARRDAAHRSGPSKA